MKQWSLEQYKLLCGWNGSPWSTDSSPCTVIPLLENSCHFIPVPEQSIPGQRPSFKIHAAFPLWCLCAAILCNGPVQANWHFCLPLYSVDRLASPIVPDGQFFTHFNTSHYRYGGSMSSCHKVGTKQRHNSGTTQMIPNCKSSKDLIAPVATFPRLRSHSLSLPWDDTWKQYWTWLWETGLLWQHPISCEGSGKTGIPSLPSLLISAVNLWMKLLEMR